MLLNLRCLLIICVFGKRDAAGALAPVQIPLQAQRSLGGINGKDVSRIQKHLVSPRIPEAVLLVALKLPLGLLCD